ncbi:RICIN domain-containing protein [Nonomuraea sp. NPDC050786]|uniref:RICIN domain-containing protein n=1 Tax=Nonomuraea sp. NPDC050786 TaxID=3154840 RepID=UPI0034104954
MTSVTGRMAALAAAAATSTLTLLTVTPAAHAEPQTNREFINRMDGSRLATYGDSVAEGAEAISLRHPGWKYRTAKWTFEVKADGHYVIKNEAANKCLQPAIAGPVAGTKVVIRTCDGSQLQDWSRRPEESDIGQPTGWGAFRPRVNTAIALTLDTYQGSGSWDTLYLNRDQNSSDRLWRFLREGHTW